jgi:hypothetical protein
VQFQLLTWQLAMTQQQQQQQRQLGTRVVPSAVHWHQLCRSLQHINQVKSFPETSFNLFSSEWQ